MPGRMLLYATLLAVMVGCGGGIQPSAPTPRAWAAGADPDSVARWALGGCRGVVATDRACVERGLYAVLESAGIATAMSALDRAVSIAPALAPDAHGLAHGLGIAAYRSPETLATTFAACPPTQMSGCYHGVIQGYFLALKRDGKSVDADVLEAVCAPHRGRGALYFQCAHGLGHGVMAVDDNHLPRALARCDLAREDFVRQSCYGGAFMENIIAVTHPHHTAEAHASVGGGGHAAAAGGPASHGADAHAGHGAAQPRADEHAGHAAGSAAAAHHAPADAHAEHAASGASAPGAAARWEPLRRSDLLYPCTAVGDRYQAACYDMQSSAAIALTLGDVGAVARACAGAPAEHVRRCYASLGRDVSALANLRHDRAVALCARAGAEAEPFCLAGVASTMHNRSNDPADAIAFCRDVPAGEGKNACYRVVNGAVMQAPAPRREALCASAEAPFIAPCRAAAGLPAASAE